MEVPRPAPERNGRSSGQERSRSAGDSRSRPLRPPPPNVVSEITDLRSLKQCHDEAYQNIQQGLNCDENEQFEESKSFYINGLRGINQVLAVNCEQIRETDEDKDAAKSIQQKMNKTKLQIEYRLQALQEKTKTRPPVPQTMETDEPPSYEESVSSPNGISNADFVALGDSVMTEQSETDGSLVANAAEIFSIADGVQIFYITPEGYVSAPSYPSSLKVFKFTDRDVGASNVEQPPAFLQVGSWLYPMSPGTTPVLQANYGAYIFPDLTSATPGSAVGLMLPDTIPLSERQHFEGMLRSLTVMRQQEMTPTEMTPTDQGEATRQVEKPGEQQVSEGEEQASTSTMISKGLLTAAEYITWGVEKGAEKASSLMKMGSEKLRARLAPEESPKQIDPKVQKGIEYVRVGSHVAVKVSSFIVTKLGQATMALAREAAPHIRKQGEKYLPKSLKEQSSDGKSTMDGVIEVAASGLKGFGTVFMGLEGAAKVLGKNLANETVNVVSHKYGKDAGQLTEHTLYSAGNIAMTAYNANHLGVKAIAKRAAKDTGKAVLHDFAEQRKEKGSKDCEGATGYTKKS